MEPHDVQVIVFKNMNKVVFSKSEAVAHPSGATFSSAKPMESIDHFKKRDESEKPDEYEKYKNCFVDVIFNDRNFFICSSSITGKYS